MPYASLIILFNEEGRVLLLRRSQQVDSYPGLYGFPGGKIEEGETSVDAAVRELYEEASLKIRPADLVYVFTMNKEESKDIIFYIATKWRGSPKVDWESDSFIWADPSSMSELDMVPTPKIVFELITSWADFMRPEDKG
tara:strand:+ start:688 stop:1104 length:417 start_codon:yes stop_codon:yes gene_type:complete